MKMLLISVPLILTTCVLAQDKMSLAEARSDTETLTPVVIEEGEMSQNIRRGIHTFASNDRQLADMKSVFRINSEIEVDFRKFVVIGHAVPLPGSDYRAIEGPISIEPDLSGEDKVIFRVLTESVGGAGLSEESTHFRLVKIPRNILTMNYPGSYEFKFFTEEN